MRNWWKRRAARSRQLVMERLEDRVFFDGVPDGSVDGNPEDQADPADANVERFETSATAEDVRPAGEATLFVDDAHVVQAEVRRELVVVDTSVENHQQLLNDLLANGDVSRDVQVVTIDGDDDGVRKVGEILSKYDDLDALHLVSHGDDGALRLGNLWLTNDNLGLYAAELAEWSTAFADGADLLIYGCDLAATADGRAMLGSLSTITGTDIAASVDDTGFAARGGDWVLEFSTGDMQTAIAFSNDVQESWNGILAVGPDAQLTVPGQTRLGENFTFTVSFDNTGNSGEVGYGPFIDLIFPVNGADGAAGTDTADGIDFISANYLGGNVNATVLTFGDDDGAGPGTTGTLDHPFAVDNTGNPLQITGTAGDKLVVLELPFGSFTPEQPVADITVTASMSNLADLGTPLTIATRAGFRFGADPQDNPTTDPSILSDTQTDSSAWTETATVTPTLLSLTKTYIGPENETATGPNYVRQYRIDVDIANGQTISNLDIIDSLPNNIVVTSIDSVTVGGSAATFTDNLGSLTQPGNNQDLIITLTDPVVGGTSSSDVRVQFSFYVPEFDADGNRIIPLNGEDDTTSNPDSRSLNNARAVGDWAPIDSRDAGGTDNAVADPNPSGPEHILDNKSIAIQKSVSVVTDTGATGPTPGDTLEYTLTFQISDYYTFGDLLINDIFQDGQLFDFGFGATLDVTDFNGNTVGSFTVRRSTDADGGETLVVDETRIDRTDDGAENPASDGSTTLTFDLSQALRDLGEADGILQGGLSDGATNKGAATGTIRFRTVIQDEFADTFPSGDRSVDQGDSITNNTLSISGTVRQNAEDGSIANVIGPAPNGREDDNSSAGVTIQSGNLFKSIYAINNNTTLPTGPSGLVSVEPGDVVTYRIAYTLPSSDFENLVFTDFLPLPVFDVDDPDGDNVNNPGFTFNLANSFDANAPAAGEVEFGQNDTFYNSNPGSSNFTPTLGFDSAANSLTITYGTYDDNAHPETTIELYFSITVQDDAFADGLFLTNIVRAEEGTTNNNNLVLDEIVQIELTEPVLNIKKGVVSTSQNEIQVIEAVDLPGTPFFTITFDGQTTNQLSILSDAATVQSELEALSNIGSGNVSVLGGPIVLPGGIIGTPFSVEFIGALGGQNVAQMTTSEANIQVSTLTEPNFSTATGPVNFTAPGSSSPAFTSQIDSTNLAATPIDANITGLDAGDLVKFAIVIENTGHAEGYDIIVSDLLQAGFQVPGNATGLNLEIRNGNGTLLTWTGVDTGNDIDLFAGGVEITDGADGSIADIDTATTAGDGSNIIVITYDLQLRDTVSPSSVHTNTGTLSNYSGAEGGEDFTATDLTDDATTTIASTVGEKSIVSTSENHTGTFGGTEQIAIGEIIRYRLVVQLPEGTSNNLQIRDRLPNGITFLNDGAATAFVTNDTGSFSSSTLALTDGGGNPLVVSGDETTIGSITPTYQMPDSAISSSPTANNDTYNSGTDIYFKFGNVTNTDNDANAEYIVIEFNAILDNDQGSQTNDHGETRGNRFDVNIDGTTDSTSNTTNIQITEPLIDNVSKTVSSSSGDAGDTVTFTVTFSNSSVAGRTTAFDVRLLDTLPSEYSLNLGSINITPSGGATGVTNNSTGNTVDFTVDEMPTSSSISVTYEATLLVSVDPGETLQNNATVTYTSLPGTNGTTSNPTGASTPGASGADLGERNGSGTGANDYTDTDSAEVTVTAVSVTKNLVSTEIVNGNNANDEAVIGELVTYQIVVTIPEGTTTGAGIVDTLDAGLAFVDLDPANPPVLNGVSISGSTTPVITNNGGTVTWNLGTITNNDTDNGTTETITLTYRAVVLNVAGNQAGTLLNNSAKFTSTESDPTAVNAADVTVIEPEITVTKSATPGSGDAGDAIQYDIVLQNTGSVDAFDVTFSDPLPTVSGGASAILAPSFNVVDTLGLVTNADFELVGSDAAGWTLRTVTGTSFDMAVNARTITITIDGTISGSATPNQQFVNTATALWSSLDGDVSSARSTHNANSVERDGSDGDGGALDDYADAGAATFTVNPPVFNKSLFATDQIETTGSEVTIGETITYALLIQLPEGVTPGASVVDLLPAGLDYTGFTLVTTAAASNGLLTADFNGTVNAPTVSGGAGDGDDVTFTFGQIDVTVDNNGGNNAFLILVDALVLDVASNVGYGGGATTLVNSATLDITGDGVGPQSSGNVNTTVVEPNLAITKEFGGGAADLDRADAGDNVTIELSVQNTGDGDAYDVIITDVLNPAHYDFATVNLGSAGTDYPTGFTATFSGGTVQYSGGTIAAGATVTFTFTVDLTDTVTPASVLNNTGTITQATTLSGTETGERNDTDPDGDGSDTNSDSVTIRRNSLAGFVYSDADNDGVFDGGETGISGVQITLTGTDHLGNTVNLTTNTLGDGSYLFDNLRPSNGTGYTITQSQPGTHLDGRDTIGTPGGNDTVNDIFSGVVLPAGSETFGANNNFGELELASLTGFVYHDADNDGVKDTGETGISGVDVRLTGIDDLGNTVDITLTTLGDGSYTFNNLRPSNASGYTLTEVAQPTGFLDGIDSDGSLANGSTATNEQISGIDVVPGDAGTAYNFGELRPSSLSGYVYHDSNNDGSRSGESGIQGVTVTLTGTDDLGASVNIMLTTDVNGFYQFTNLRPDNGSGYTITETQPGTHLDGDDTIGTPGGNDTVNDVFSGISIVSDTNGTENNFGELVPATIGGTVFNDHDNDGIQDTGEPGIQGVTVTLTGTDDRGNTVNINLTTDANGNYQFTNLRPDNGSGYTITQTQPTNYNDGIDTVGSLGGNGATNDVVSQIDVDSADAGTGYNFAERGASITGTVFRDDNRDGGLDTGEPGIGGVTIELYDAGGTTLIATTTTLGDGTYRFDNLPAGDYQIRETQPQGYSDTSANTRNVTLPLTGLADQDFGEALWDLGDLLYFDANADGDFDAGEPRLANVDVTLLFAGFDNIFGNGDDVTQTVTTDANGFYQFTELFNGLYRITPDVNDLPPGMNGTEERDDTTPGIDGTSNITVNGADRFDVDFGYAGSGTIGNFVWLDVDNDGVQDTGEPGLANITVNLRHEGADGIFGNADDITLQTVTDANGQYTFANLPAGDFQISVDTGDTDLPGSITAVSGPESIAGTANVTLTTGETNNDIDFGFAGTLTLGDLVWFDQNGNGTQQTGEPGFGEVTVNLRYAGQDGIFNNGDDVTLSDITDANGAYGFANLADGEYQITYVSGDLPGGISGTVETDDSSPGIDGTSNITLNGTNRADVDFGFNGAGVIGNFVWLDVDGDGVQDTGEPGLANVDVNLTFAGEDGVFGNGDDFTLTVATDANGLYTFNNLPDGNFRIAVDTNDTDLPGSITGVSGTESIDGTANVTLLPGNRTRNDIDFGFVGTRTVGDFVWFDVDADGTPDTGEPGYQFVDLTLRYAGQDGTFNTADDVVLNTTTDGNGVYGFSRLPDGEYRVAVDTNDLPSNVNQTYETNDGANTLSNTAEFSINGANRPDIDFGYAGDGSIRDTVFFDIDNDGVHDGSDRGLPNVDITLQIDFDFNGSIDYTITTQTDADGNFVFTNLFTADYTILVDSNDFAQGLANNPTVDPDGTGTPHRAMLRLGVGEHWDGPGFGYHATPNYRITKDDGITVAKTGDEITYTILVENIGELDGRNIVVTDTYPNAVLDILDANGGTVDADAGTITWNFAAMQPGESTVLTVTAQVRDPAAAGIDEFTNTVTVTDDGFNGTDPDLSNNTATDTNELDGVPDYRITKTDDLLKIRPGQPITYVITVENVGNQDGTGVVVTDLFPVGLLVINSTGGGEVNESEGTITWNIGDLAAGETVVLEVEAFVAQTIPPGNSKLVNEASVEDDGTNGNDPTPDNNTAEDETELELFAFDSFNDFSNQGLNNGFDLNATTRLYGGGGNGIGSLFSGSGTGSLFAGNGIPLPGNVNRGVYVGNLTRDALIGELNDDGTGQREVGRRLGPLQIDTLYTGLADPGTTLTGTIYDKAGREIATQTVVADAGGNWVMQFPTVVLYEQPHTMRIVQTSAGRADFMETGYNLRRYFHPAVHTQLFYTEPLSIDGVFRNAPFTVIGAMHAANLNPLTFASQHHSYELHASSSNAGER